MTAKNLTYDELLRSHQSCSERWIGNSRDGRLHRDIATLVKQVSRESRFAADAGSRQLLKSIYDKWHMSCLAAGREFPQFEFHDYIADSPHYDVKSIREGISRYLGAMDEFRDKKLYAPQDELISNQIFNFYCRGAFISFYIGEVNFSFNDLFHEIKKIFSRYRGIVGNQAVRTIHVISMKPIEAAVLAEYEASSIRQALARHGNGIEVVFHHHGENTNGFVRQVRRDMERIDLYVMEKLSEYYFEKGNWGYDAVPEVLPDHIENERAAEMRQNIDRAVMARSGEDLFSSITTASFLLKMLKDKKRWEDDNPMMMKFHKIGTISFDENESYQEYVTGIIRDYLPQLSMREAHELLKQIDLMRQTRDALEEKDTSVSAYQKHRGLIAEFWIDTLTASGHDEFRKLKGLAYYVYYLKEIGMTFLKVFAGQHYLLLRDYYFPVPGNPHALLDVERSLFDGKTHYDISKTIMTAFNLPEIFYDVYDEADMDEELRVIDRLVRQTGITIHNTGLSLNFVISSRALDMFKGLAGSITRLHDKASLEGAMKTFIDDRSDEFFKRPKPVIIAGIYRHMMENYMLGEIIFDTVIALDSELFDPVRFSRYTLLKNLVLYIHERKGMIDSADKNLKKFIEAIFFSGPSSSRAFLAFQFACHCRYEQVIKDILAWLAAEEMKSMRQDEVNREIITKHVQFLKTMSGAAAEGRLTRDTIAAIISSCTATPFTEIAIYFKMIYAMAVSGDFDDELLPLIHNSVLLQEMKTIIAYMETSSEDIFDLQHINPLVRRTIAGMMVR